MVRYAIGDCLPKRVMRPSALQLFRFSAVTWNGHRIHFDREWALHEGHGGLVVHSHLHAAHALTVLTTGLGSDWCISHADYRIVRPAVAGDDLTASAQISDVSDEGDVMHLTLREINQRGEACLEGTAIVRRTS